MGVRAGNLAERRDAAEMPETCEGLYLLSSPPPGAAPPRRAGRATGAVLETRAALASLPELLSGSTPGGIISVNCSQPSII